MALSVSDIIAVAKISQYLAQNDAMKGSLFGARVAPDTAKILFCERSALEWAYNLDTSYDSLTLVANYVYSLCRGYNLKAQRIFATSGGGSVAPADIATAPSPIQFNVTGATTIATGATSAVITSFIGYNLLFVRGGIPQTTVDEGGGASYYAWDRTTGTITISPAAIYGELLQLYPV